MRFILWPNIWSILENVPCAFEKHMCSAVGGRVFYRCLLGLVVYRVVQVFYFLVDLLPVHYWKCSIKVSSYYYWIVYFSFQFCPFLLLIFWALLLGTDMFIIFMSSWWIDPSNIVKYLSLSLVTYYVLKPIFFWY